MTKNIELDSKLLSKLQLIADKDNIPLENLIEVAIINFLMEKGQYEKA